MATSIENSSPLNVRRQLHRREVSDAWRKVPFRFVLGGAIVLGAFSLIGPAAADQVKAFPTAEGFGAKAKGGRGGIVYEVTNLNGGGKGSLREGLKQSGPRTIVFRTGGEILLKKPIVIKNPFVTIAGQTAPGDGITLRGEGLKVKTHDVIVRHIRIRIGDEGKPTNDRDAINIATTGADDDVRDVIIDHSSVSWGIDENLSTFRPWNKQKGRPHKHKLHDITVQWSISSEALHDSIHIDEDRKGPTDNCPRPKGKPCPHSKGMYISQNGRNISVHHNILAHNTDRNPRFTGIKNAEFINNVVYNWGDGPTKFGHHKKRVVTPNIAHVLNNYYKPGKDTKVKMEIQLETNQGYHKRSKIFIKGNVVDIDGETKSARVSNRGNHPRSNNPLFESSGISTSSAKEAFKRVLKGAGATKPGRDKVDKRIVRDIKQGKGRITDRQDRVGGWPKLASGTPPTDTDKDGMPDDWEQARGLNPNDPKDRNGDKNNNGYTDLEDYLNELAGDFGGEGAPGF